jgi:hypothetical protein
MSMVAKLATSKAEFDGMCYRGGRKERFWPTPTATDGKGSGQNDTVRDRLDYAVEKPDGKRIPGQLNPTWVEWLMGYPEGWTDLEHSETQSSPKSPK